ncbi:hypothetical protein BX266_7589 [Streptomyces sp. TLI_171]|nr:hypothetical protein BX266_7589 [Streptomyces sp. TLI_171]
MVRDFEADVDDAVRGAARHLPSETREQFVRAMGQFTDGGGGLLRGVRGQVSSVSGVQRGTASQIFEGKVELVAELVQLFVELVVLEMLEPFFPAWAGVQRALLMARARVRLLVRLVRLTRVGRLGAAAALEALSESLTSFAAQTFMIDGAPSGFRRRGYDWRGIARSGAMGAFIGGLHKPALSVVSGSAFAKAVGAKTGLGRSHPWSVGSNAVTEALLESAAVAAVVGGGFSPVGFAGSGVSSVFELFVFEGAQWAKGVLGLDKGHGLEGLEAHLNGLPAAGAALATGPASLPGLVTAFGAAGSTADAGAVGTRGAARSDRAIGVDDTSATRGGTQEVRERDTAVAAAVGLARPAAAGASAADSGDTRAAFRDGHASGQGPQPVARQSASSLPASAALPRPTTATATATADVSVPDSEDTRAPAAAGARGTAAAVAVPAAVAGVEYAGRVGVPVDAAPSGPVMQHAAPTGALGRAGDGATHATDTTPQPLTVAGSGPAKGGAALLTTAGTAGTGLAAAGTDPTASGTAPVTTPGTALTDLAAAGTDPTASRTALLTTAGTAGTGLAAAGTDPTASGTAPVTTPGTAGTGLAAAGTGPAVSGTAPVTTAGIPVGSAVPVVGDRSAPRGAVVVGSGPDLVGQEVAGQNGPQARSAAPAAAAPGVQSVEGVAADGATGGTRSVGDPVLQSAARTAPGPRAVASGPVTSGPRPAGAEASGAEASGAEAAGSDAGRVVVDGLVVPGTAAEAGGGGEGSARPRGVQSSTAADRVLAALNGTGPAAGAPARIETTGEDTPGPAGITLPAPQPAPAVESDPGENAGTTTARRHASREEFDAQQRVRREDVLDEDVIDADPVPELGSGDGSDDDFDTRDEEEFALSPDIDVTAGQSPGSDRSGGRSSVAVEAGVAGSVTSGVGSDRTADGRVGPTVARRVFTVLSRDDSSRSDVAELREPFVAGSLAGDGGDVSGLFGAVLKGWAEAGKKRTERPAENTDDTAAASTTTATDGPGDDSTGDGMRGEGAAGEGAVVAGGASGDVAVGKRRGHPVWDEEDPERIHAHLVSLVGQERAEGLVGEAWTSLLQNVLPQKGPSVVIAADPSTREMLRRRSRLAAVTAYALHTDPDTAHNLLALHATTRTEDTTTDTARTTVTGSVNGGALRNQAAGALNRSDRAALLAHRGVDGIEHLADLLEAHPQLSRAASQSSSLWEAARRSRAFAEFLTTAGNVTLERVRWFSTFNRHSLVGWVNGLPKDEAAALTRARIHRELGRFAIVLSTLPADARTTPMPTKEDLNADRRSVRDGLPGVSRWSELAPTLEAFPRLLDSLENRTVLGVALVRVPAFAAWFRETEQETRDDFVRQIFAPRPPLRFQLFVAVLADLPSDHAAVLTTGQVRDLFEHYQKGWSEPHPAGMLAPVEPVAGSSTGPGTREGAGSSSGADPGGAGEITGARTTTGYAVAGGPVVGQEVGGAGGQTAPGHPDALTDWFSILEGTATTLADTSELTMHHDTLDRLVARHPDLAEDRAYDKGDGSLLWTALVAVPALARVVNGADASAATLDWLRTQEDLLRTLAESPAARSSHDAEMIQMLNQAAADQETSAGPNNHPHPARETGGSFFTPSPTTTAPAVPGVPVTDAAGTAIATEETLNAADLPTAVGQTLTVSQTESLYQPHWGTSNPHPANPIPAAGVQDGGVATAGPSAAAEGGGGPGDFIAALRGYLGGWRRSESGRAVYGPVWDAGSDGPVGGDSTFVAGPAQVQRLFDRLAAEVGNVAEARRLVGQAHTLVNQIAPVPSNLSQDLQRSVFMVFLNIARGLNHDPERTGRVVEEALRTKKAAAATAGAAGRLGLPAPPPRTRTEQVRAVEALQAWQAAAPGRMPRRQETVAEADADGAAVTGRWFYDVGRGMTWVSRETWAALHAAGLQRTGPVRVHASEEFVRALADWAEDNPDATEPDEGPAFEDAYRQPQNLRDYWQAVRAGDATLSTAQYRELGGAAGAAGRLGLPAPPPRTRTEQVRAVEALQAWQAAAPGRTGLMPKLPETVAEADADGAAVTGRWFYNVGRGMTWVSRETWAALHAAGLQRTGPVRVHASEEFVRALADWAEDNPDATEPDEGPAFEDAYRQPQNLRDYWQAVRAGDATLSTAQYRELGGAAGAAGRLGLPAPRTRADQVRAVEALQAWQAADPGRTGRMPGEREVVAPKGAEGSAVTGQWFYNVGRGLACVSRETWAALHAAGLQRTGPGRVHASEEFVRALADWAEDNPDATEPDEGPAFEDAYRQPQNLRDYWQAVRAGDATLSTAQYRELGGAAGAAGRLGLPAPPPRTRTEQVRAVEALQAWQAAAPGRTGLMPKQVETVAEADADGAAVTGRWFYNVGRGRAAVSLETLAALHAAGMPSIGVVQVPSLEALLALLDHIAAGSAGLPAPGEGGTFTTAYGQEFPLGGYFDGHERFGRVPAETVGEFLKAPGPTAEVLAMVGIKPGRKALEIARSVGETSQHPTGQKPPTAHRQPQAPAGGTPGRPAKRRRTTTTTATAPTTGNPPPPHRQTDTTAAGPGTLAARPTPVPPAGGTGHVPAAHPRLTQAQNQYLSSSGQTLYNPPGDGDCFYHALLAAAPAQTFTARGIAPTPLGLRTHLANRLRAELAHPTGPQRPLWNALEESQFPVLEGMAWTNPRLPDEAHADAVRAGIADAIATPRNWHDRAGDITPYLARLVFGIDLRRLDPDGALETLARPHFPPTTGPSVTLVNNYERHWMALQPPTHPEPDTDAVMGTDNFTATVDPAMDLDNPTATTDTAMGTDATLHDLLLGLGIDPDPPTTGPASAPADTDLWQFRHSVDTPPIPDPKAPRRPDAPAAGGGAPALAGNQHPGLTPILERRLGSVSTPEGSARHQAWARWQQAFDDYTNALSNGETDVDRLTNAWNDAENALNVHDIDPWVLLQEIQAWAGLAAVTDSDTGQIRMLGGAKKPEQRHVGTSGASTTGPTTTPVTQSEGAGPSGSRSGNAAGSGAAGDVGVRGAARGTVSAGSAVNPAPPVRNPADRSGSAVAERVFAMLSGSDTSQLSPAGRGVGGGPEAVMGARGAWDGEAGGVFSGYLDAWLRAEEGAEDPVASGKGKGKGKGKAHPVWDEGDPGRVREHLMSLVSEDEADGLVTDAWRLIRPLLSGPDLLAGTDPVTQAELRRRALLAGVTAYALYVDPEAAHAVISIRVATATRYSTDLPGGTPRPWTEAGGRATDLVGKDTDRQATGAGLISTVVGSGAGSSRVTSGVDSATDRGMFNSIDRLTRDPAETQASLNKSKAAVPAGAAIGSDRTIAEGIRETEGKVPDVISDWLKRSRIGPLATRSLELQLVDLAVAKLTGKNPTMEQLRNVIDAISQWEESKISASASPRWGAISELKLYIYDELASLGLDPRFGLAMPVSLPGDANEAAPNVGIEGATQEMVPGARDLQIARWLQARDSLRAAAEARAEASRLQGEIANARSIDNSLVRMWERQVRRINEDLTLFDELRSRPARTWAHLREPQVAALIIIEKRCRQFVKQDQMVAKERLRQASWGQPYTAMNLDQLLRTVHKHLQTGMLLVTTMGTSRLDALFADPAGAFRNRWEVGTSQAVSTLDARAAAEKAMGYSATLGVACGGTGENKPKEPRDLPKYAALLSRFQPHGISVFGNMAITWKQEVRARSTFTPSDSLDSGARGARAVTGAETLYSLLAYGSDEVVRLAFAEATSFAYDLDLKEHISAGSYRPSTYFEAQIHGDLSWGDVDRVVIPYWEEWKSDAERDREKILSYTQRNGYALRVDLSCISHGTEPIG